MSFFSYPNLSKRKNRLTLYGLVLLEVVAISFIIPSSSSTGEQTILGCNNPVSLIQCGSGVCTVSFGALPPSTYCSTTITFPTQFVNAPKFTSAMLSGINNTVNHQDKEIPIGEVYFQSDAGETWNNMPTTADNEIYSSQTHETMMPNALPLNSKSVMADFSLECINPSFNGTTFIRPEYQDLSFNGKWKELARDHMFLDINVGQNSNCSGSGPSGIFGGGPPSLLDAGIADGLAVNFTLTDPLRVVGFYGNGTRDVPEFNNIYLSLYSESLMTPALCISTVKLCYGGTILTTKSSMQVMCVIQYTPLSGYECNFKWEAIE